MPLRSLSFDQLVIDDEAAFARVPLYPRLKAALRQSGHRFLLPDGGAPASWDRVLFLNLTYWNGDQGTDVLMDDHLAADVVSHIAWHSVVGARLKEAGATSGCATAMLFGEAIASAFDLHVLGRLWREAPGSDFVTTQVPIMSEAAQEAGLTEDDFAALLADLADDPDRAFEDLRELLFDASTALVTCPDAVAAEETLERFAAHRFAALLHHFQLSNWILYARAYSTPAPAAEALVRRFDAALRQAPSALSWLAEHWLRR